MAVICPAILADNPHAYRTQLERVTNFARRLHIDVCDGEFTRAASVMPEQIWWPKELVTDIHLMYKKPETVIQKIINLRPSLVILHSESQGDFFKMARRLRASGIKVGLALLQATQPEYVKTAINQVDHILIFSGDLGSFGGRADMDLLKKIQWLRTRRPDIEIGWDGGVNDQNARRLVDGGVDVLDIGGYIQRSQEPQNAYDKIVEVIGETNSYG